MAAYDRRKKFLQQERDRLTRFQNQHRGLNFLRLCLPPTTDQSVNIIGIDNHVYRGQVPAVPVDQLPPDVDSKSIDEDNLYEEIRTMRFPETVALEPLGPTRRVAGEHTKAKRLMFAPVGVHDDENIKETPIVGADGHIYRGAAKAVPVFETGGKKRGAKKEIRQPTVDGPEREHVKLSVVSLYVDGKPPAEREQPVPLIELPISSLNKMIEVLRKKDSESMKKPEESLDQDISEPDSLMPEEPTDESSQAGTSEQPTEESSQDADSELADSADESSETMESESMGSEDPSSEPEDSHP